MTVENRCITAGGMRLTKMRNLAKIETNFWILKIGIRNPYCTNTRKLLSNET